MFVEKRRKYTPEISTASMAHIAFLLIIFFIVITKFGTDKGIDLTLPPEGSIKEIPKNNIMSITMDDAGAVVLDGKAVILGQVQSLVKTIAEANDRLVITVKTTRKTPYRNFIAVMDQLKEAGVRKISVLEPDR